MSKLSFPWLLVMLCIHKMFFISDSNSRAKCCFQDLEKTTELLQLAALLQAVISETLALTEGSTRHKQGHC